MNEFLKIVIDTLVGSIILILFMCIVSVLVIGLDHIRIKLMNIFYNTKLGSLFKKYHIFEAVIIGLFLLIILLACVEMGRQMIGVYFK